MKEKESFSIKKEWLQKLKQEAFGMNKEYYSLVFNFGNDKNYYILEDKIFIQIINLLKEID